MKNIKKQLELVKVLKLDSHQRRAVSELVDMYVPKKKVDGYRVLELKLKLGLLTRKEYNECIDIMEV